MTPGSWTARISRSDSKNSLTRFCFSTFPHLSCAVSQTSHPLPRGPAAPSACDLIQNHYCTPHLTEVCTRPPPRAPETPPPPPPPPSPQLALKNVQLHNTDSCFPLFRRVTALWCRVETHSLQLTQTLSKHLKAALVLIFRRFCSCPSWSLWAKTVNAKCERGSGTCDMEGGANTRCLPACICARTCVCI